jgi:hypothetical protein
MNQAEEHVSDSDLTKFLLLIKNDEDIELTVNWLKKKNLVKPNASSGKYLLEHLCLLNKSAKAHDLLKQKVMRS